MHYITIKLGVLSCVYCTVHGASKVRNVTLKDILCKCMCKDVVDVGDVHVDVHVCVQIAVEEVTVGADVDVVDIVGKCAKN